MGALGNKGLSGAAVFDADRVTASAWFDGTASYLEQTSVFGSNEESARFILSFWVLRCEYTVAATAPLICTNEGGNVEIIRFDADDKLRVTLNNQAHVSNEKFKDLGWYHFVVSVEVGGSPDLSVYVNGEAVTWGTDVSLGANPSWFNSTNKIRIGRDGGTNYGANYFAQVAGIPEVSIQNGDYTITDFGDNYLVANGDTVWAPKSDADMVALVDGAGKSNSFILTSGIGDGTDAGTNSVGFTANSVSAATNGSANTPSRLYPVLNRRYSHLPTGIAEGCLNIVTNNSIFGPTFATMSFPTTGKYYMEVDIVSGGGNTAHGIGIALNADKFGDFTSSGIPQDTTGDALCYVCNTDGKKSSGGTDTAYGSSVSNGEYMMLAYDADAGKIWFGKEGTWFNSGDPAAGTGEAFSGITATGQVTFIVADGSNSQVGDYDVRFEEGLWEGSAPTGFVALNSENQEKVEVPSSPDTGSFVGNANADGPVVFLGYRPNGADALTINSNAVTWGTHADILAYGFKLITASASYNAAGSNTWSLVTTNANTVNNPYPPSPGQEN